MNTKNTLKSLFERKIEILQTYLNISIQLQINHEGLLQEFTLEKRGELLDEVKKIDSVIEDIKVPDHPTSKELKSYNTKVLNLIRTILDIDQEVEKRFEGEKNEISENLNQLNSETKLVRYLGTTGR